MMLILFVLWPNVNQLGLHGAVKVTCLMLLVMNQTMKIREHT